VHKM